jgi:hypothetical protein
MTVLIPTYRADGDWRDLDLAVRSIRHYAPDQGIVVGWAGPHAPELIDGVTVIERPSECRSSAQATWWLADRFGGDEFVLFSDDCVATPTTFELLAADVARLKDQPDIKVGMVGCRSNFAAGAQNIRYPNGSNNLGLQWDTENTVFGVQWIAPFVAWIAAEHLAGFTPPDFEWYSDNWHCAELVKRGYTHFVSRSYVHHIGMQSSKAQGLSMDEMNTIGLDGLGRLEDATDAS